MRAAEWLQQQCSQPGERSALRRWPGGSLGVGTQRERSDRERGDHAAGAVRCSVITIGDRSHAQPATERPGAAGAAQWPTAGACSHAMNPSESGELVMGGLTALTRRLSAG